MLTTGPANRLCADAPVAPHSAASPRKASRRNGGNSEDNKAAKPSMVNVGRGGGRGPGGPADRSAAPRPGFPLLPEIVAKYQRWLLDGGAVLSLR
ncbi:hypothetical protein GCM10007935_16550 [Hydrogenophaga electricum]|uniref:Uncharacterized protein n=1 Tax=Hydrogenophaga electricum TaxID=1230953 RepID=A0ABQ6C3A9_9BURK|nr:hypothetical protein GCM10007935_16550 [Hydrogenophaga electricum]